MRLGRSRNKKWNAQPIRQVVVLIDGGGSARALPPQLHHLRITPEKNL